jgi:hypothetical protein
VYESELNSRRSRNMELEKDFKLLQKKYQQVEVENKSLQSKKEMVEKSCKEL